MTTATSENRRRLLLCPRCDGQRLRSRLSHKVGLYRVSYTDGLLLCTCYSCGERLSFEKKKKRKGVRSGTVH